jgi:hypothetical protein
MQIRISEIRKPTPITRRTRSTVYRWVIFLSVSAMACAGGYKVMAQMTSGGAMDRPGKPLPPGMRAPRVDFRDLAPQAGLNGVIISGAQTQQNYIVEQNGTGVALLDYDNDGLLDIFFVQGDRLTPSSPPLHPYLYHNLGGLRFEDVTDKAGLGHLGWGQGVCAGDFDNDGYVDLFVTQWGHNVLLRNMGNGTFRDVTKESGLDRPGIRWSTGCAFLDYDRDGLLDLAVANYVDFDPAKTPKGTDPDSPCTWKGIVVPCGPIGLKGETMSLYHNDGHGHFTDVSKRAGVEGARIYKGLTVLTGDFDNDGWPDFYVACDSTPSLLFHNKRDGTFEEVGVLSGTAYNQDGIAQSGMGAAAADYDGDGWLDILKGNFANDTPTLYHSNGNGTFDDATLDAGLAVHTQYVQWGLAFLDIDQDGWKDIFIADGHVYPSVETQSKNEHFNQPRQLYWNMDGNGFYDMSSKSGPGIIASHSSRGIAVGDLDNDGEMEIVTVNLFEPPSLLKNSGEKGNSLLVRALTTSGRDAIGARITVSAGGRKQIDEVRSGGYYVSSGDFRCHFGLGKETMADVTVRWPQGKVENFPRVSANRWVTIRQGKGIVRLQPFTKAH